MAKTVRAKSEGIGWALGASALFNIAQAVEVADVRAQLNTERHGRIAAEARALGECVRAERAESSSRIAQNDLLNKQAECRALQSQILDAQCALSSKDRQLASAGQELATATARIRELEAELARRPPREDA
jgi:hypothetical protein